MCRLHKCAFVHSHNSTIYLKYYFTGCRAVNSNSSLRSACGKSAKQWYRLIKERRDVDPLYQLGYSGETLHPLLFNCTTVSLPLDMSSSGYTFKSALFLGLRDQTWTLMTSTTISQFLTCQRWSNSLSNSSPSNSLCMYSNLHGLMPRLQTAYRWGIQPWWHWHSAKSGKWRFCHTSAVRSVGSVWPWRSWRAVADCECRINVNVNRY